MKRSVLVLVILLASISVGSAFAITIRLAGDVTVDGTLDVIGTITIPNPTVDNLQGQIINLGGIGGTTPINAATLDGLDSLNFAVSNQSCQAGQIVTGFDASGNEICKKLKLVRDLTISLGGSSDSSGTSSGTSIAIGTDGNPIISYDDSNGSDLKVIHCTTPSCSRFDQNTLETISNVGDGSSIAIGFDGFPVISHTDFTNSDLRLVHCTDVSCSSISTPVLLDSIGDGTTIIINARSSIAIGSDNFPVITYDISTSGMNPIVFIHCTNVSCSSFAAPIDIVADAGGFSSVAIGTDNNPIVAYSGGSGGSAGLTVSHCTNQTCTAIDAPTVIDSSDSFVATSMAIGSDGFPFITYQDSGNLSVRFVHCTNATCSSFGTPFTIPNSVGDDLDHALAIGIEGFPVIAFRDSAFDLKILYCKNLTCSNFEIVDTINDRAEGLAIAIGNNGLPVISAYDTFDNFLASTRVGGILLDGTVIPNG